MNRKLTSGCFLILAAVACHAHSQERFAGSWETSFGPMYLNQEKASVTGFYHSQGAFCKIEGTLDKSRWTFAYQEPLVRGEGHFELAADGQSISGLWRPRGFDGWQPWTGRRVASPARPGTFAGVWATSFGRMRLQTNKDQIQGTYAIPFGSSLSGELAEGRFTFEYREPQAKGEGWFELAADGRSFQGKWRPEGTEPWLDWYGVRIEPVPGRSWLVIVEVHWEHDLAEPEYSFGAMLRAFFARSPRVEVRHRFANSAHDLAAACHEVAYLAEPVVLVVSSHGDGNGVNVRGQSVGATTFSESLKNAPNIRLLHFSSCSVMEKRLPAEIMSAREVGMKFPISGYTQPVDWAASAVLEFMYFDFILSRGLPPAKAAEQVKLLMPFAGSEPIPKSLIPPAGFRLLTPARN